MSLQIPSHSHVDRKYFNMRLDNSLAPFLLEFKGFQLMRFECLYLRVRAPKRQLDFKYVTVLGAPDTV